MTEPLTISVPAVLEGERLDRVVALESGLSRSAVADLVERGEVTIDGEVARQRSVRLEAGQTVRLVLPDAAAAAVLEADSTVTFDVLYADDDLLVIDKPADLIVHAGAGHEDSTLVNGLLARYPEIASVGQADRPGIVHRLDRGTSGALMVARTQEAYTGLVERLSRREVERIYWTLVLGVPESGTGTIDAPIGRSSRRRTNMAIVADGRPAVTHYEMLEAFERPVACARLLCRLETGRTHQIRVHLASIAHPVVGDRRYGRSHGPFDDLDRMALHAQTLRLEHPVTGRLLEVEAPLPAALSELVQRLSAAPG
jgi:23S rRNA pseudouridine1911/1915/1917 synthase